MFQRAWRKGYKQIFSVSELSIIMRCKFEIDSAED